MTSLFLWEKFDIPIFDIPFKNLTSPKMTSPKMTSLFLKEPSPFFDIP